jgi:hypothetical protein
LDGLGIDVEIWRAAAAEEERDEEEEHQADEIQYPQ